MTAVFVTGSGTEIGKTFVTAGLVRHLRAAGRPVSAIKPVVTGFDPAAAAASDAGILLAALGRRLTPQEIERIAPFRFAAPLAPDMAARREGRSLDFEALLDVCRRRIAETEGALLIEGVGGVMVPLDEHRTVLDWMAALRLPLILVAGSYLGSISHTLTALDAARRHGLAAKALVVNETACSTVAMADTIETLGRFVGPVPIVALPRLIPHAPAPAAFAQIAALL